VIFGNLGYKKIWNQQDSRIDVTLTVAQTLWNQGEAETKEFGDALIWKWRPAGNLRRGKPWPWEWGFKQPRAARVSGSNHSASAS